MRRWSGVFSKSLAAWVDHRAGSKGAALAFYALFSMTPILFLAIAGAGYFYGAEAAQGKIIAQIEGQVGQSSAQAIRALLIGLHDPARGFAATLVASFLLLVGATSVFVELKGSLDELWGVEPPKGLAIIGFLQTRLHAFGVVLVLVLVLVLAFLLLAALVLNTLLIVLEHQTKSFLHTSYDYLATSSSLIAFGVLLCLFAIIFKTLSDVVLSWRDVWIGALFTTILFGFGKYAIGIYLAGSWVSSIFGAAGALIALLLWIYYSAQMFFLGAAFTRQYALCFGSLQHQKPFVEALLLSGKPTAY